MVFNFTMWAAAKLKFQGVSAVKVGQNDLCMTQQIERKKFHLEMIQGLDKCELFTFKNFVHDVLEIEDLVKKLSFTFSLGIQERL